MVDLTALSERYGVSVELLEEYRELMEAHGIPMGEATAREEGRAQRLLMVSTHGYWGDPPPAGVPDTGGQTYYVLEVSKAWARQGREVIIFARWFEPFPRVEQFADGVWLVRLAAGSDEFVRKEEIYGLCANLSEAGTAVGALFGAEGVMGHYADGMANAVEMGERLGIPAVTTPHSMGVLKMMRLGWDPLDQAQLRDPEYHFWARETYELAALRGANFEIANTPREPEILEEFYGVQFPNAVMPAGAAKPFFEAGAGPVDAEMLARFGVAERKYVLFWGRLSDAKFVEGVVQVLGEARALRPDLAGDVVALIIGGSPDNPSEEERGVEEAVAREMARYGLTTDDVRRVESQNHAVLAPLSRGGLAYVGMQKLEPFGMGAAEAMGAGLPTMISANAGITRWLTDGEHALFVKPDEPREAAQRLLTLLEDPARWEAMSADGRAKSLADFSWDGIARRQGLIVDALCAGEDPREAGETPVVSAERFTRRTGRAYHRTTPAWRGDVPHIKDHHVTASAQLVPLLVARAEEARAEGKRLTVAVGGESGSGKSEIAHLLTLMLRAEGKLGVVVPGDAFFKLAPAENHANRVACDARGALEEGVGPQEVDLARLDAILAAGLDFATGEVSIPSDCRAIPGRRYPETPLSLEGMDVLLIDLTYSLLLDNATTKIFLQRSVLDHIEAVRARNLARDPGQDFDFVQRVLEREHSIIAPLEAQADIVVGKDYEVVRG